MLLLLWLLFWLPVASLAASQPHSPSSLALRWVGYVEQGRNRGQWVDSFNLKAGSYIGAPYCASFVYWILDSSRYQPRIRTGFSRAYVRYGIPVWELPTQGAEALLVWIRKNGGHIGFVVRNIGRYRWETVEANTSRGTRGNQYNGDGIYRRVRQYEPFNTFRITHIVLLRYARK